jgi:hypothetical protein
MAPRGAARVVAGACLLGLARAAGSAGLRGAHPDVLALLLGDEGMFACDGGAVVLPLSRFNDDYCDCADGADEPGACAWGPLRFAGPDRRACFFRGRHCGVRPRPLLLHQRRPRGGAALQLARERRRVRCALWSALWACMRR